MCTGFGHAYPVKSVKIRSRFLYDLSWCCARLTGYSFNAKRSLSFFFRSFSVLHAIFCCCSFRLSIIKFRDRANVLMFFLSSPFAYSTPPRSSRYPCLNIMQMIFLICLSLIFPSEYNTRLSYLTANHVQVCDGVKFCQDAYVACVQFFCVCVCVTKCFCVYRQSEYVCCLRLKVFR